MELNEKLALWAGLQFFPECECIRVKGICWGGDERTYGVDGKWHFVLPNFTSSLDACFKHLVPKLHTWVIRNYVPRVGTYHKPRAEVRISYPDNKWGVGEGEAETPALALCKAIEQLIDKEIP